MAKFKRILAAVLMAAIISATAIFPAAADGEFVTKPEKFYEDSGSIYITTNPVKDPASDTELLSSPTWIAQDKAFVITEIDSVPLANDIVFLVTDSDGNAAQQTNANLAGLAADDTKIITIDGDDYRVEGGVLVADREDDNIADLYIILSANTFAYSSLGQITRSNKATGVDADGNGSGTVGDWYTTDGGAKYFALVGTTANTSSDTEFTNDIKTLAQALTYGKYVWDVDNDVMTTMTTSGFVPHTVDSSVSGVVRLGTDYYKVTTGTAQASDKYTVVNTGYAKSGDKLYEANTGQIWIKFGTTTPPGPTPTPAPAPGGNTGGGSAPVVSSDGFRYPNYYAAASSKLLSSNTAQLVVTDKYVQLKLRDEILAQMTIPSGMTAKQAKSVVISFGDYSPATKALSEQLAEYNADVVLLNHPGFTGAVEMAIRKIRLPHLKNLTAEQIKALKFFRCGSRILRIAISTAPVKPG